MTTVAVPRRRQINAASIVRPDSRTESIDVAPVAASAASDIVLDVRGVEFSYGVIQILFGIDLHVMRGELVALLGNNGAGKSTLLRVIAGLETPTAGSVHVGGADVTSLSPAKRLDHGLALVPENKAIFPDMTVAENLEIAAFTLRASPSLVRERTDKVLGIFPRLGERSKQLAGSMSGGEKQMLSLAKAFLLEPKLLLIDELSLGLAPVIVDSLLEAVTTIRKEGASVVLVEQSFNIAASLCERAVFIQKGEVTFQGAMSDLTSRPELAEAVFFGGHDGGAA
jgi:ABC-type branched-subunit amino acid transport system ATPase component